MSNKSKNCIKRERPLWWTPEGVLSRLQSGEFVMAVCQAAVDAMAEANIQLSPLTLRAEVSKWAESASWGEQFKAALSLWKKSSSGQMVLSKDWHDDFIAAMDACEGNGQKAAAMADISYGVVLAVLDRRNKCYDREFAERFRIAEMSRVGRVRERYLDLAETGEGKTAVRAQEKVLETSLPGVHGQRQEVNVTGKIDHDHQHSHIHGLAPGLTEEVMRASQDRIRKLTAGRQGLLPADTTSSDKVIDLNPEPATEPIPASTKIERRTWVAR